MYIDSSASPSKTAVILVSKAMEGCQKDFFNEDTTKTLLFLDCLNKCSNNYDWDRICHALDKNGDSHYLILQHSHIYLEKNHVDGTYWTSIKDGSKNDGTDKEVQM